MLLHGRLSILSKLFLNYSATVSVAVLSAFKESAAAAAASSAAAASTAAIVELLLRQLLCYHKMRMILLR